MKTSELYRKYKSQKEQSEQIRRLNEAVANKYEELAENLIDQARHYKIMAAEYRKAEPKVSWVDLVVRPLADELLKMSGKKNVSVLGPAGISGRIHIVLHDDP